MLCGQHGPGCRAHIRFLPPPPLSSRHQVYLPLCDDVRRKNRSSLDPTHENVLADALSRFDLTHPIITPSTRAVINSDLSPFAEPFVPPVPSSVSSASSSFS